MAAMDAVAENFLVIMKKECVALVLGARDERVSLMWSIRPPRAGRSSAPMRMW